MVCGRRGKRGAPVGKGKGPWRRKLFMDVFIYLFIFLGGGEEKMKTIQWSNLAFSFFQIAFFGAYILKNQYIHFLVHGQSSWSIFGLYLVRGPKAL